MPAKRAWICTKKYHPVEVLSGTCSLMVWFFKASSSVVIKGFNGWRKTSVFLQPVELDWRWSILHGLRQLRDVWKGVCSPGNFLGPLSSSSRTRIWSLLPWGSHQGVFPAHRVCWKLCSTASLHWLQARHAEVLISRAFMGHFHFIHSVLTSSVWHFIWFLRSVAIKPTEKGEADYISEKYAAFHFPKPCILIMICK